MSPADDAGSTVRVAGRSIPFSSGMVTVCVVLLVCLAATTWVTLQDGLFFQVARKPGRAHRAGQQPGDTHEGHDVFGLRLGQNLLEVRVCTPSSVTANGVPLCTALAPRANRARTFSWLLMPPARIRGIRSRSMPSALSDSNTPSRTR